MESRIGAGLKLTSRDVQACNHVADHAAVELVACNASQLGKNGLAIWTDVDIGVGRIKGGGLIGIKDQRPRTGSIVDAVEGVRPFQRRDPRVSIESERHIACARRRAHGALEKNLSRFVERSGAMLVAEYVPDHCPPAAWPEQLGHLGKSQVLVQPVER